LLKRAAVCDPCFKMYLLAVASAIPERCDPSLEDKTLATNEASGKDEKNSKEFFLFIGDFD